MAHTAKLNSQESPILSAFFYALSTVGRMSELFVAIDEDLFFRNLGQQGQRLEK